MNASAARLSIANSNYFANAFGKPSSADPPKADGGFDPTYIALLAHSVCIAQLKLEGSEWAMYGIIDKLLAGNLTHAALDPSMWFFLVFCLLEVRRAA